MRDVAARGRAVLFISSDFEDLVDLCDPVLVRGRLVRELDGDE